MPKQYQLLNNKPLLRHTVEAFYGMPTILSLSVVIAPEHATLYEQAVSGLNLQPPVHGGAQRSESVYKGLLALPHPGEKDVVLIHDAARPFVMACDIARVAEAAARYGAATLAAPVSDTLRRGDGTYIDRDDLWAVQTPQGFHYGLLRRAHEAADKEHTATDDTGLVARLGHDVKTVEGNHRNIKITTADDMIFARQLLGAPETRTGFGYDVHAFGPSGSGPVRLCGLDIPHEYGLKGHSDADVGLHALTDAILGALSLGDIGQHFPPTDPQWKGAASEIFLKHAVNMTRAQGGRIVHMDVTLICEAPKIGPHRAAMQERIAAICGLAPDRVSVKATTTEGLGFTGRREGIAAQAVATLELPRGSEI